MILVISGIIAFSFSSCKSIYKSSKQLGREFPGMSAEVLKKISKETGVPTEQIVYPDNQTQHEMALALSKNQYAFPFIYMVDETGRLVVLPDSLTSNNCTGVLDKYLKENNKTAGTGQPLTGAFYTVSDSTMITYLPGKQHFILGYVYSLGTSMSWFYRSMNKLVRNDPEGKKVLLVMFEQQ